MLHDLRASSSWLKGRNGNRGESSQQGPIFSNIRNFASCRRKETRFSASSAADDDSTTAHQVANHRKQTEHTHLGHKGSSSAGSTWRHGPVGEPTARLYCKFDPASPHASE